MKMNWKRGMMEGRHREEQHGYRQGRSTIGLIIAVQQLTEEKYEYGEDLVMVLMDVVNTFNSVKRSKSWLGTGIVVLPTTGVPKLPPSPPPRGSKTFSG
ncbi:hypothetical protein PR048_015949 [Dryococelus australis]|uniref:Reverse transcriptase domain-containing protein n=1 Tax=Dryococelus australis TaxID=614101 RepID=A0ABQ9HIL5_9NEOP|nr:hypothetical protein PR048_015949 [Dryococelus australis]